MAAVAPFLAAGSGLLGTALNIGAQSSANEENRKLTKESWAFQERMANTAYQRAVQDMEKAGINPMLAYMKGGADAPSGGTGAPMQSTRPGDSLSSTVASSLQAAQLEREKESTESQIKLQTLQGEAAKAQSESSRASALSALKTADRTAVDTEQMKSQSKAIAASAELEAAKAKADQKFVDVDALGSRAGKIIDSLMDVFSGVTSARSARRNYDLRESEALNRAGKKGLPRGKGR